MITRLNQPIQNGRRERRLASIFLTLYRSVSGDGQPEPTADHCGDICWRTYPPMRQKRCKLGRKLVLIALMDHTMFHVEHSQLIRRMRRQHISRFQKSEKYLGFRLRQLPQQLLTISRTELGRDIIDQENR